MLEAKTLTLKKSTNNSGKVVKFVSLDGKDNKILNGYNSVDEKENINMGQAINDLEIL